MFCRFCGAKKQKDKAFCEYCGARFPVQQPAVQQAPTYPNTHNAGSKIGGSDTYTTTETFGRGTLANPNQKVDKRTVAFILFILFAPFIVGIVTVIIINLGNFGAPDNKPKTTLTATLLSEHTANRNFDAQHNTYNIIFKGSLRSTSNEPIRTAVIYFDLYEGSAAETFYKTIYVVLYDLLPGETRDFTKTVPTYSNAFPHTYQFKRVDCYTTLYYPARGEITNWSFTLSTSPQTQANFTVGIRNHGAVAITRATLQIQLFSYETSVGEFSITIENIPAGQERKIELGTRVFTATGIIDETTAVVLWDIKFI